MGKTTHDFSMFYFCRCGTLFGCFYNFSIVLMSFLVCCNMLAAGISGRISGKHAFFISGIGQRGNDAVGCEQDRTIERGKLLPLFPPGISIVSCKMCIFFKCRIVMCRKHFTVSIYVHATVFGLFQQFFQIMQVMSAYQNTGAGTCSYIYMGNFRITIPGSICLVEQSHCSNAYFTCFQC